MILKCVPTKNRALTIDLSARFFVGSYYSAIGAGHLIPFERWSLRRHRKHVTKQKCPAPEY